MKWFLFVFIPLFLVQTNAVYFGETAELLMDICQDRYISNILLYFAMHNFFWLYLGIHIQIINDY